MAKNIKCFFICLLCIIVMINSNTAALSFADQADATTAVEDGTIPVEQERDQTKWPAQPDVSADAAIVIDCTTGCILYQKDIYTAYYPASITKMLTAVLALENCSFTETVTVSQDAVDNAGGSMIGLVSGEQLSLEDALYGMLLMSANEVANAIAEHVSGSTIAAFADMMNEKVKELGGVNSNFVNPNGLHDPNHYTCAYDMALICKEASTLPELLKISGTRTYQIPATNKNVARDLVNHHRFIRKTLNYEYAIAGKTGGTDEALTTLITFAKKDDMLIAAIVLHVDTAEHAYEDTINMCNFAFDNYTAYKIKENETAVQNSIPELFDDDDEFKLKDSSLLTIDKDAIITLPSTASFSDAVKTVTFNPPEEYEHGNNIVGKISYKYDGTDVGAADIYYYVDSYPMTAARFKSLWPSYLIPPDTYFKDDIIDGSKKANENETTEDNNKTAHINKKALLYALLTSFLIVFAGILVIYVYIPEREWKKRQRRLNRR